MCGGHSERVGGGLRAVQWQRRINRVADSTSANDIGSRERVDLHTHHKDAGTRSISPLNRLAAPSAPAGLIPSAAVARLRYMPPRLMVGSWIAAYHLPHWRVHACRSWLTRRVTFKPLTRP